MGLIAKSSKPRSNNSKESWGMGFLLVFFPEDQSSNNNNSNSNPEKNYSSLSSFSPTRIIKRTNSNNIILTRAQFTISICVFLVFLTFLLFTLSTFEQPSIPDTPHFFLTQTHRRFLQEKKHKYSLLSSFTKLLHTRPGHVHAVQAQHALQRMGVLYRRGTRAMNDLVVAHVVEHVSDDEFRLFLRFLHRSGLTSKADIAFIFPTSSSRFGHVLKEEDYSFMKLIEHYNTTTGSKSGFDLTQFVKSNKQVVEPIWGRRTRSNSSDEESETEPPRLSYGSVVGFEATELDPENSLSGFLDHVTMSLRRWACYPMLLGRVKRKFKHIMLVDVKNELIVGDPLSRIRSRSSDSVQVFNKQENVASKHGKKTQSHNSVNSGIIMGGERGVRRFSNAMLNEIVRAAMQHNKKKKNSMTESGVLSQLVGSEFILKDSVSLVVVSGELVPEASQLVGSSSKSSPGSVLSLCSSSNHTVIQRGNSNNNDSVIREQLCSCEVDSGVYKDCLAI